MLVAYANLAEGQAMVVEGLFRLGNESVALVCRLEECDGVLYAEGDVAS